jgi:Tfp pilus assembly protein PilF
LELDTTIPAALTFLENGDAAQALRLLDKAIPQFPRDPRLRLMHALATTLAGHDAATEFHEIETRWPEWSTAWVAHALVLQSQGKPEEARRSLATAATLGDTSPIQNIPLLAAIPFLFPSNPR